MITRLDDFWIDCVKHGLAHSIEEDTQQIIFYKPNTMIIWTFAGNDEITREVHVGIKTDFGDQMQADDLDAYHCEMTFNDALKLLFTESDT